MIVLDVETTGTEPTKHSLVSIGALDFNNPQDQFYAECRIWDGAHVDPVALTVNGFTEAEIRDPAKETEAEIVARFYAWLQNKQNHTIAGQNPSFDLGFVLAAGQRAGLNISLPRRTVDLHTLAYFHIVHRGLEIPLKNSRTNIDSDYIMAYVGIPTEPKPHKALNGAIWEAEAFARIFRDKPFLEQFVQFPVPWA